MNRKRVLIILNPMSGTMQANKVLTEIIETFGKEGWMPSVLTTRKPGDAGRFSEAYAADFDLVVAIGGDGTFSDTASGVIRSGAGVPLGYIPAGSTNDFGMSVGLEKDILANAARIAKSSEYRKLDFGSFNGKHFSYVACCGIFSKTSYSTPQPLKNLFGHTAYILEGIREGIDTLTNIGPMNMELDFINEEGEAEKLSGDFLLAAVSNSTSVGGVLTLKDSLVEMDDGKFEVLLIHKPKDLIELTEIIHQLTSQEFSGNMVDLFHVRSVNIRMDAEISWSLDGEEQAGAQEIRIENLPGAVSLVL